MRSEQRSAPRRALRVGGGFLILGTVLAALLVLGERPEVRLPLAAEASAGGWADESKCIRCHEQANEFWQTGHAQTLQRATTAHSRKLLAALAESPLLEAERTTIQATPDRVTAATISEGREVAVELDWCFGSGHHATTWASTVADSSGAIDELEFRWSHYGDGVVAITPGQFAEPLPGRFGKLGVWFDSPKAYRCFSCHASVLPVFDGVLSESHIKAGVTCQKCHGPRLEHVQTDGAAGRAPWPQDRLESVHRCAQCHRRSDELDEDEISVENHGLVRFQPAGLMQSRCFIESNMDCLTCHDPHKPMAAQNSRGIWQCVQCHNPDDDTHVLCAAGETDDCLQCHMPGIRMDAPLTFTDHWIRVREPAGE